MKRHYLKIRISLMTFALGLASALFVNYMEFLNYTRINKEFAEEKSTIVYIPPRFFETSEAIYNGQAVNLSVTFNGEKVLSGNIDTLNKSGINERTKQAKRIIENGNGRYVLEFNNKKERHYEILQYITDELYYFIHAPTLELALEFEEATSCKGDLYLETDKTYIHY